MTKNILVIDDEELLTKSFSKVLEKQGHHVYTVKNGSDAVVIAEEEDFDLIISDIRMPGENGIETVQKIQNARSNKNKIRIPVIFVTGYADDELEKEARKLNPSAYLYKPFDIKNFIEIVASAMSK